MPFDAARDLAPWGGLFGACLVAAANYGVQRWRYRIDRTGTAVDHLCVEINAAADLSTRYWLLDASQKQDASQARLLEPELLGRQSRLQGLFLALAEQDLRLNLQGPQTLLADFYNDLTGGTFKDPARSPEPEKAQSAHSNAALLNGELRAALARRSYWWL